MSRCEGENVPRHTGSEAGTEKVGKYHATSALHDTVLLHTACTTLNTAGVLVSHFKMRKYALCYLLFSCTQVKGVRLRRLMSLMVATTTVVGIHLLHRQSSL